MTVEPEEIHKKEYELTDNDYNNYTFNKTIHEARTDISTFITGNQIAATISGWTEFGDREGTISDLDVKLEENKEDRSDLIELIVVNQYLKQKLKQKEVNINFLTNEISFLRQKLITFENVFSSKWEPPSSIFSDEIED